jgi:hypothetical protein
MTNLFQKQINEVVEIENMFIHLKDSAKQAGIMTDPFKFFGFPDTTIHYHIYREIKLSKSGQNLKWRYRDQDENGLERCLTILNAYKIIVNEEVRASMELLSVEKLEFLADISNRYQNKVA